MPDMLVDSDVLIDHLRGAVRFNAPSGARVYCSVVTRAELLAGPAAHESDVRALLGGMRELPVTSEVAEAAGLIRRETKIGLPDALIAATALAHGLHLMTRNVRDFSRVAGLGTARS